LDDDQYLIPRRDGKILAGSSVEQDGFNKTTTTEARDRLNTFAVNLLPSLKSFPVVKHWAGLRPGTEHGVPYIDKHPEINNLYINAGHFRNGLAMGPASAQLMVDLVLNRPTSVAPIPYQLTSKH
jgi:Glycine/D-amino acid oxidases (deaminating)